MPQDRQNDDSDSGGAPFDRVVRAICARHGNRPDALIEILHGIQTEFGHVPPAVTGLLAAILNRSRAEVHGVVSFYHDFRDRPPARHVVKVCRAEACQAIGSRVLERHARERLCIDFGEQSADGRFALEEVFCLGNCALSPAIMVDGHLHGRVDVRRFDEIVGLLQRSGAE